MQGPGYLGEYIVQKWEKRKKKNCFSLYLSLCDTQRASEVNSGEDLLSWWQGGIRGSSQVQDGDHMLGGSERAVKTHCGAAHALLSLVGMVARL